MLPPASLSRPGSSAGRRSSTGPRAGHTASASGRWSPSGSGEGGSRASRSTIIRHQTPRWQSVCLLLVIAKRIPARALESKETLRYATLIDGREPGALRGKGGAGDGRRGRDRRGHRPRVRSRGGTRAAGGCGGERRGRARRDPPRGRRGDVRADRRLAGGGHGAARGGGRADRPAGRGV